MPLRSHVFASARRTQWAFGRLGPQLIASVVIAALISGVSVGAVTIYQARAALHENVLHSALGAADLGADLTATYVSGVEMAAVTLSSRPEVQRAIDQQDYDTLTRLLERWLQLNPRAETVTFWDKDGVNRAHGLPDKTLVGQSYITDTRSHDIARSTGKPYLGMAVRSRATGRPIAPFIITVTDSQGQAAGELTVGVSLTALTDALTSARLAPEVRTSLVDLDNRMIISHPDASRILTASDGHNDSAAQLYAGKRGVLDGTDSKGVHMLAAFEPVQGLRWGILIQEPSTEAFAPVDTMAQQTRVLCLFVLAMALFIGVLLAMRMIKPLSRLRAAALAMAHGNLAARARIDRVDEIGEVGVAFDTMAEQLAGTVHQLELAIDELQDSEKRKGAILTGALDAIISMDAAGRITEFNPSAEEVFGYTRDEVLGRDLADVIIPPAQRDAHRKGLARAASGEPSRSIGYRLEMTAIRRDGTEFPAEVAITSFQAGDEIAFTGYLRDITERKRAERALAHQAVHDALTGLPNRVLLRDRLEQAILGARREGRGLGLLVMDLDRFKEINDTLGHHAGDLLLQEVARRLRDTLRASDTVARLGGDEFAVVLTDNFDGVAITAGKLLAALETAFELEGHRVAIGASLGIAMYPEHGDGIENLLRHADVAMYAAKRGHTGWATYSAEHDQHSFERLALVSELREALTRTDELMLHYQPKMHLADGSPAGVEALIRWHHPRRGLLGPDHFVNLAEQTGLMRSLTRWVVEAALRQVRAWLRQGVQMPVAINLSPSSLQDGCLADEIGELLAAASVDPRWLEVEITEDAYMAHPDRVAATLAKLRAMGVRVAIDDFGTGYSSLVYLQKLSVDVLKIDRRFVRTMTSDAGHATIVRSIVDLGHNLGLEVVAEGVEDDATYRELAQLGCDQAQGYALGRPVPAADLLRLFSGGRQHHLAA